MKILDRNLTLRHVKLIKISDVFYEQEIKSMIKLCKVKGYGSINELLVSYLLNDLRKYK